MAEHWGARSSRQKGEAEKGGRWQLEKAVELPRGQGPPDHPGPAPVCWPGCSGNQA